MNKARMTEIYDVCPVCGHRQRTFSNGCDDCGYRMGKDWAVVEIDIETGLVVRTVIAAQPHDGTGATPPRMGVLDGHVAYNERPTRQLSELPEMDSDMSAAE